MNQNSAYGKGVASMVLGILSLVFSFVPFLGAALALVAVIMGGMALNRADDAGNNDGRGMAIAGLVCGIIGLVVGVPYLLGASCLIALLPSYWMFI